MSIRIEIADKWVITSDQFQFILNEKKSLNPGKTLARNGSILSDITRRLTNLLMVWFIIKFKPPR